MPELLFSGPDDTPTQAERRLIDAVGTSSPVDCEDLPEAERVVSAILFSALARGTFQHPDWPNWHAGDGGVNLTHARIRGAVELQRAHVRGNLRLQACALEGGLNLDSARVDGYLFLGACIILGPCSLSGAVIGEMLLAPLARFENPGGVCLQADRLTSQRWYLERAVCIGSVNAMQARVDGDVYAAGITIEAGDTFAFSGSGMRCASWVLSEAKIDGTFDISTAEIDGAFVADRASFNRREGSAIIASEITCGFWNLDHARISGQLNLSSARLDGPFFAPSAVFDNGTASALTADQAQIGNCILAEAAVTGVTSLNGATVGYFSASQASFVCPGGTALWANGVQAANWDMDSSTIKGRFVIRGSNIAGSFSAPEATLDNPGDVALWAHRVRADGWDLYGATVNGYCDLRGAEIGAILQLTDAVLSHPQGDALIAAGAHIGNWWMNNARIEGGVNVNAAVFDGAFNGSGVNIEHPSAAAINAQAAVFHHGVLLNQGARLSGELDLTGATLGQGLDLSGSEFRAGRHRAVRLQDARISGGLTLRDTRLYGHVHANRARIEGRLDLKKAEVMAASVARSRGELRDPPAPAIDEVDEERQARYLHHAVVLQEARIDGRLVMPSRCPQGIVDLSRARCDTLEDDASGWPAPLHRAADVCDERLCIAPGEGPPTEVQYLVLNGFEYRFLEFPAGRPEQMSGIAKARSDWLAGQSVEELKIHFNPQPWLHAASVLRAMGHDEEAQDLAIARRVRQRLANSTPRFRRVVSRLLHLVSDYGFNPWKTVQISVVSVLLFALAYWALVQACGGYGVWSQQRGACGDAPPVIAVRYGDVPQALAADAYPAFTPIMYSLDMFVPFLDLGADSYWHANTRAYAGVWPVGWILYLLTVLERFVGAILLAIAITGFTGLLTRDER